MNNEKLETNIASKKKSSKVLFIILGLFVLGVISLYAGIKIISKLSVSADTLPPIPGDPIEESATATRTSTATATATYTVSGTVTMTVSATSTPYNPDDPVGPPINLTINSGWSMVSGTTLYNFDVSPITQKGIYFYSFNDPFISNRNWVVSSLSCNGQKDYFCTSLNQKFSPWPYVGYYLYNPGSSTTVTLNQVSTPTYKYTDAIFGRGWHLVRWSGPSVSRATVLNNMQIWYNDKTSVKFADAISENLHLASTKIYVIMDPSNITSSAVKELTDTDSSTTVSKIPSNTYFWAYLRRSKQRAIQIVDMTEPDTSTLPLPPMPNLTAISNNFPDSLPPVPANP